MGIVIGECGLIKDQRRRQPEIVGNCVTRTHMHAHARIHTCTQAHGRTRARTHARTTSGIRDSLPLCVMVSKADMAEWLS